MTTSAFLLWLACLAVGLVFAMLIGAFFRD